ncbi:Lrp/AsnC family transcriptional regulator [Micromonospora sp. DT48]|uniref:Lrp/AsnC family transcriptional regulator n=1 Tax=unclassified Micromonospora TaxID=2617518 RepID=UPI0012BC9340|nr:Lrp/AsnC family transcriptional regulator [Micromonospora sp. CP22]MTK04050.1 Lrp/AsnC family transcriptional regulator [Micromonospora sp. CP22]
MGQEVAEEADRRVGTGRSAVGLDEVDRRILDELTRDGRLSIRTLAERVHVSRTNAYARVERLLRDGVITGFAARVAPEAAGLGTSAYIALTIRQNTWREVAAELAQVRYVEHVALLSGEHDVLALVRAPDNATLRDVVLDRMQHIAGVLATRSWLVFEEYDGVRSPWA